MGYYTCFNISFRKMNNSIMIVDEFDKINDEMGAALANIHPDYFYPYDSLTIQIESELMKWYEYDEDMRKLSKQFPDFLFILEGDGEDPDDLWRNYYYNGKCQHCPARIEYDPFDMESLI